MPAGFRSTVANFDASTAHEKLGHLIAASASAGFATHFGKQTDAWLRELAILHDTCRALVTQEERSRAWVLLLEFEIPRREKRPDAILLAEDVIFVLEFKVGANTFDGPHRWQVLSYGLDLRDFHAASQGRVIVPFLVATDVASSTQTDNLQESLLVQPVQCLPGDSEALAARILDLHNRLSKPETSPIEPDSWENAPYRPTPTIIEAAQAVFAGHSVANISHAFAQNLSETTDAVVEAISLAQTNQQRLICFVTGVPGAGKTLTGLNVVHDPRITSHGRPAAVFLSGNGPLIKIVREALIRDRQLRGAIRKQAQREVRTLIDNVHSFLRTYGIQRMADPSYESAFVFDEAQRAWNAGAVYKRHKIQKSEPEILLEIMERAQGWCAIVALVGGGQEIHTGEAGLAEWGIALNRSSVQWRVLVSPEVLRGGQAVAGQRLFSEAPGGHLAIVEHPELHLNVSVRSPRARLVGQWVNALLGGTNPNTSDAETPSDEFPVALTRDLETARGWLRMHSEETQRCGLLASSGALRLRAHGIEVSSAFRKGVSYADWFLNNASDTRSSSFLEIAATEFDCQGLELDWTCVCWGGDLVMAPDKQKWRYRQFRGTKWRDVKSTATQGYITNRYRVLLTRARRGMVIWVPTGDSRDATRESLPFDTTAEYLHATGIELL